MNVPHLNIFNYLSSYSFSCPFSDVTSVFLISKACQTTMMQSLKLENFGLNFVPSLIQRGQFTERVCAAPAHTNTHRVSIYDVVVVVVVVTRTN
jgi:hypothetical protein